MPKHRWLHPHIILWKAPLWWLTFLWYQSFARQSRWPKSPAFIHRTKSWRSGPPGQANQQSDHLTGWWCEQWLLTTHPTVASRSCWLVRIKQMFDCLIWLISGIVGDYSDQPVWYTCPPRSSAARATPCLWDMTSTTKIHQQSDLRCSWPKRTHPDQNVPWNKWGDPWADPGAMSRGLALLAQLITWLLSRWGQVNVDTFL